MTPAVDRADVEQFRTLVTRRFGLHFDNGKLDFLSDVLRRRMEAAASPRPEAYLEVLRSASRGRDELKALAEQLTVAETFFFRNADHFRAVAQAVLPERVRAQAAARQLRILSAGCASGDEPYSLAILVREALSDLGTWEVQLTGLDLNPAMLAKATHARYSAWALRATSEDTKRRYFRADGPEFVLDPAVQRMVTFEERNLVDPDPLFWQADRYDLIFCRNVLMYLTAEAMREVVQRLRHSLLPGGFLFVGHAETLRGLSQDFRLCHTHDTFYYQRRDGALAARATPGVPWDGLADLLPRVVETTASWVEVIQQASERIAALTTPPAPLPPARSWDLTLVLEAMRQERFSDALDLLSALPPESNHQPDALLLRAALLTNGGRLDEAEAACARLLELDELNAGAHYLMALCREHARDSAGAIEHDQTAVYLDPGFAMPHLHLGLAARRSGDSAAAQHELGQALLLLAGEEAARLLLFGGGFSRDTLLQLCRSELHAAGGGR